MMDVSSVNVSADGAQVMLLKRGQPAPVVVQVVLPFAPDPDMSAADVRRAVLHAADAALAEATDAVGAAASE